LETTRSYVRKNREQVIKFLRGYIEGIAYFKKNKNEVTYESVCKLVGREGEGKKWLSDLAEERRYRGG
jgi:ABC-type nitrate/sulfonate/bicarbonate transport system substrate-binding protein